MAAPLVLLSALLLGALTEAQQEGLVQAASTQLKVLYQPAETHLRLLHPPTPIVDALLDRLRELGYGITPYSAPPPRRCAAGIRHKEHPLGQLRARLRKGCTTLPLPPPSAHTLRIVAGPLSTDLYELRLVVDDRPITRLFRTGEVFQPLGEWTVMEVNSDGT